MTDHIDTEKGREWLGRLFLTIAKVEHSHACDGGYSIVGSAAAAAIERVLSPRLTAFLDALDAERARAEKAEAERDQALARLAAVQDRMRTSAAMHVLSASLCPRNLEADRSYLVNKIRALPIDPDAEAALQRVVDARMGPALEACQIIDSAVREGHDNTSDLILHLLTAVEPARAALKRPEASHD